MFWLTWLQPAQVTGCDGQVRFQGVLRLVAFRRRHANWVCKLVQTGFADVCKLGLKSVQLGFVSRVVLALCQSREMLLGFGGWGVSVKISRVLKARRATDCVEGGSFKTCSASSGSHSLASGSLIVPLTSLWVCFWGAPSNH